MAYSITPLGNTAMMVLPPYAKYLWRLMSDHCIEDKINLPQLFSSLNPFPFLTSASPTYASYKKCTDGHKCYRYPCSSVNKV